MPEMFDLVTQRRAIIERRTLSDALMALEGKDAAQLRQASVQLLRPALEVGRGRLPGGWRCGPVRGGRRRPAMPF